MSKKIILFFVLFFTLFSFKIVSASIVINEIMYDLETGSDTDREWVEVYNDGATTIDFSIYKFFEANTNHGLVLVEGDKDIPPSGYAVIVQNKDKFKIDWPNFTGAIFDSSFSLGNETGELLAIKDADLNIVDQYTYSPSSGGAGNGKSLQLVSGSWQEATPTPGLANSNTNTNTDTGTDPNTDTGNNDSGESANQNSTSGGGGTSSSSSVAKSVEELKTKISIIAKKEGFVGLSTPFGANGTDKNGKPLFYGKYFWNFGDGDSKEIPVNIFTGINHTYFYPGVYTVILEYYLNDYTYTPEASASMTVSVVKNDVLISKVGDEKDFFVEIANNTDYSINISKWVLQTATKTFIFPKNTFVPSKNKIIISPKITGFTILDKTSLKLLDQDWKEVFDYSLSITPTINPTIISSSKTKISKNSKTANQNTNQNQADYFNDFILPVSNSQQEGNLLSKFSPNYLNAQVIGSASADENNNYLYFILLLLLIGFSIGAVYYIKKKKNNSKDGEDFDILDE